MDIPASHARPVGGIDPRLVPRQRSRADRRSLFALRSLRFTAFTFGLLLAVFGIASLIGASVAPWCGTRLGSLDE